MKYKLINKRPFTLDSRDFRMFLMHEGDEVKIEDGNVFIKDPQTPNWYSTIEMVTPSLLSDLQREENETNI